MFRNFFKIAWRNLAKHKQFSFINIVGLAFGMTVCMLALAVIKGAYYYDTFHTNAGSTYRVLTQLNRENGDHLLTSTSPLPLGSYLKKEFMAVEKCTHIYYTYDAVTAHDKNLEIKEAYVDTTVVFYKQSTYMATADYHFERSHIINIPVQTAFYHGLLGMVIYTTQSRSNEVGIRKVTGSSVRQIIFQVSKDFMLLLVIAVSIVLPAGYITGSKFPEQYAYRIPVSAGILTGCAAALLCLGGITIGWQTYRTAIINPVKSLRVE